MNRQEFFRRLEYLLRELPESERMDALAYYNDYFDDAGVENEQQVIQELGSPEQVAQMILEDYHRGQQSYGDYGSPEMERDGGSAQRQSAYGQSSYQEYASYEQQEKQKTTMVGRVRSMSKSTKILMIILLVLTCPIWIGVVVGLFGGIVGLLGGLFGVVVGGAGAGIGMLAGGLGCLVVGVLRLFASPVEGVVTIGVGALLSAISVLLVLLFALIILKWLPALIRAIVKWARGLMHRQEGGDEI